MNLFVVLDVLGGSITVWVHVQSRAQAVVFDPCYSEKSLG
jgi:hypothetical protein